MGRTTRQKINKETEDLNIFNTINQLDPTDIYRTLHPTAAEYAFSVHTQYSPGEIMCYAPGEGV